MSKYAPLGSYLKSQKRNLIPMTFSEIEALIDSPLPASKKYPAWWSNNTSNSMMTKEWLAAGYKTESVDVAGEKLVFRKTAIRDPNHPALASGEKTPDKSGRAPIFGCMVGTFVLSPDLDPALPADPELADHIDEKYKDSDDSAAA